MPQVISKDAAQIAAQKSAAEALAKQAAITAAAQSDADKAATAKAASDQHAKDEQLKADAEAAAKAKAAKDARQVYRFVKNVNVKELISLPNGEVFQFPQSEFKTSDAELAKNLLAVAHLYSIVQ